MAKSEAFENFTKEYDEWFVANDETYVSELRAIKSLLPEGTRGLEVGVGTGRFGVFLGAGFGVDPSHRMTLVSKSRGLRVCEAVAEDLPFRDGTFESVLMVTVICFLDDPDKALSEAYRVLTPRGSVIIGFIDKESHLGRQYGSKKAGSRFYKNAVFYSAEEVQDYLKKAGFHAFQFAQTILPEGAPERGEVRNGFGEGGFVAVRAEKQGRQYGQGT